MYDELPGMSPFRVGNADRLGLDRATLRRGLHSGDLVAARPGVLVGRRRIALAVDARSQHLLAIEYALAGLRRGSSAVACLGSAAAVHELSRLGRLPERVRLYRERGGQWRDADLAVLVCKLPDSHTTEVSGIPVTTRTRTAVDLARWVSFRSGVVVIDSALRGGSTRALLEQVSRDCARWPGIRKAREVIAFADGRAASPLESVSRHVFRAMGLPTPELQVSLAWDEWGNARIIVDFYWPEFGVVGEADGLLKYDDDPAGNSLRAEKLRQEELEGLGYIVVRWTWDDIWRRPEWVVARLRTAFQAGASRRRP